MRYDLVVRSRRAVLPDGTRAAAVAVSGPAIAAVEDYGARLEADHDVDLGDLVLLPGLVDTHVHVNEPGRTEWEGFATATRAAAAGGVTTICDMPLNSLPPTVSVSAATDTVGGSELSGMSQIVVTPPAAAARVAVVNPSHSVRPGNVPLLALAVGTKHERALARSDEYSYTAHRRPLPEATDTILRRSDDEQAAK